MLSARLNLSPADCKDSIEREFNGGPVAPLVAERKAWMRIERTRRSRHAPVAKAMNYMLNRWDRFTRFSTTDASAWRTMPTAGAWVPRRAMYTLVVTAKRKGVDPQAWFADVLTRIA